MVDKKRTDLPEGIFNGLPSPAGALIVLGAALVFPPMPLWVIAALSVGLMVSHIRFAHFGRVILKQIPRPLFFLASSTVIVTIAFHSENEKCPCLRLSYSLFCFDLHVWREKMAECRAVVPTGRK